MTRSDDHSDLGSLYATAVAFTSPIVDFYLTDPISRASAVMAECSRQFVGGRELGATGTHG